MTRPLPWSDEDLIILDRLYGRFCIKVISLITGHPYESVKTTARNRGLAGYRKNGQRGRRIGQPARAHLGGGHA